MTPPKDADRARGSRTPPRAVVHTPSGSSGPPTAPRTDGGGAVSVPPGAPAPSHYPCCKHCGNCPYPDTSAFHLIPCTGCGQGLDRLAAHYDGCPYAGAEFWAPFTAEDEGDT